MRILVVEDEQKIAQSIKKGLEQESFAVDISLSGDEGLDLGLTEDYDLIILDLMLPKKDGMEICRELREKGISIPILMLTAKGQISDKVVGLNLGADDYLTKPFDFEELVARVKALSRRPKQTLGSVLSYADLSLDTVSFQVKRGKSVIQLSHKEFSLLEYLLRHKKQIVTKNQLIAHVWDFEADVLPNIVEVYIGYLRSKVDKPFKNKPTLIQTVRGFGYKLEEKISV